MFGLVGVDDQDTVDAAALAADLALDQQGDRQHDIGPHAEFLPLPHLGADQRVQDGFEITSCRGVGEHEIAQPAPLERPVAGEYAGPEAREDSGEARCSRGDDRARGLVGVDHGYSEFREAPGHRTLAAGDAAGQTDAQPPRQDC